VAERWGARSDQVLLYGFTGGGQFVQRFAYLHPRRLAAVSIGVPGRTTLLDPDARWPDGTADFEARFRLPVDLQALTRMPAQVVVGRDDTDPSELAPGSAGGGTRVERAERLAANWRRNGISVQLDIVAGAAHDSAANLPAARSFLATHLAEGRR